MKLPPNISKKSLFFQEILKIFLSRCEFIHKVSRTQKLDTTPGLGEVQNL